MKLNLMAPCAHRVTVSAFALAGCLALPAGAAVTNLTGDHAVIAGNGGSGNLTVAGTFGVVGDSGVSGNSIVAGTFEAVGNGTFDSNVGIFGDLELGGNVMAAGLIDFGFSTINSTAPGGTLQYLGTSDHVAAFDVTEALGSFVWRDDAGLSPQTKMKLGTDNSLSLYSGSTATIALKGGSGQIHLSGTGSGVYAGGTSIFSLGSSGNVTWDRPLAITSGAGSTSSSTGALTVVGGMGVGQDSYIHGIRIGQGPGNISSNTVVGADSLIVNTTGHSNATLGAQTLNANTTGRQNVAVGYNALKVNTTGSNNSATGFLSMLSMTTGVANTAYGAVSLRLNTTGNYNTAIGNASGMSSTTSSGNTSLGAFALNNNTTGGNNIAIGYFAGSYQGTGTSMLTSPENSIYIGYSSRALSDADENSIVIGHNALGEGANTTVIGNSSTTSTHLYGQTKADSLKVNGASDLNNQVVVEPAVAPATAVRAMRVLADGTVLIKPSGDIPMGDFDNGAQP